jgi:hypothetical protein
MRPALENGPGDAQKKCVRFCILIWLYIHNSKADKTNNLIGFALVKNQPPEAATLNG